MVDLTNYTRWITASINKWIDAHRQDVFLYVEGQVRKTADQPRSMEARIDGPKQRPCGSKDEYCFVVEISILCAVKSDETDFYSIQKLLGIASQALNSDIPVYQFGDNDSTLVGCLQLKRDPGVEAHAFGQVDAETQLIQGCAEAHYEMYL